MSVLVIENYPDAPMGNVGRALEKAGIGFDIVQAHAGEPVPGTSAGWSGLVVLGGSQNALDDEAKRTARVAPVPVATPMPGTGASAEGAPLLQAWTISLK